MERIPSRKDPRLRHFRRLGRERDYREETGLFLCDGAKLLDEAVRNGACVNEILFREGAKELPVPSKAGVYIAPDDVFEYASPLVNSPGPLFSVKRAGKGVPEHPSRVMVLENVQDPGNVGTVLRTAAALGIDLVVLAGECADPYNPKTVRAAMGALFRQPLLELPLEDLFNTLKEWELPLFGAALLPEAADVRRLRLTKCAVAVGNEGNGLSDALLARCSEKIIIPMTLGSESLNAAVAASLLMWEMTRG